MIQAIRSKSYCVVLDIHRERGGSAGDFSVQNLIRGRTRPRPLGEGSLAGWEGGRGGVAVWLQTWDVRNSKAMADEIALEGIILDSLPLTQAAFQRRILAGGSPDCKPRSMPFVSCDCREH